MLLSQTSGHLLITADDGVSPKEPLEGQLLTVLQVLASPQLPGVEYECRSKILMLTTLLSLWSP